MASRRAHTGDGRGAAPVESTAGEVAARRARSQAAGRSTLGETLIAGVPARIMRPRLVFLACLVAITAFGVLMVYSASSVEAQSEGLGATYFAERQLLFAIAGAILAGVVVFLPNVWKPLRGQLGWTLLGIAFALLIIVFLVGAASGGARRWMSLGFFTLQPSEFVKPAMIVVVAGLLARYFDARSMDIGEFAKQMGLAVGPSLFFIVLQPDLGTTIIITATVFAMMFLAGLDKRIAIACVVGLIALGALAMVAAPYRFARFMVALDPWQDPYGDGYQATLAIMAFASGGLFGRGIGNSTMKYNYLPEAHNDYILAIIGEELGFVGTVIFFAVFALMIWSAFKIAREAPDTFSRLVAEGCAVILMVQFLVNALGIIGVTPMTGKTLPFISYGGSSLISCMLLAGLILRVSRESTAAQPYRARRAGFAVMGEDDALDVSGHTGRSTAGQPRVRRSGFSVYDGSGGRDDGPAPRAARPVGVPGRPRTDRATGTRRGAAMHGDTGARDGYDRVDLNRDARDRLRTRSATVRTREGARGRERRDRYDR